MAATERSGPADRSSTSVAASARGESGALVTATAGEPCSRAAASTATTSGEAPDCESATTALPRKSMRPPYTVCRLGVASATGSPVRRDQRYCA